MAVKKSSIRSTSLLLFVIASVALGQQSVPPTPDNRHPIPIFALLGPDRGDSVTGDSVTIDPILLIDGREIRPVPNPCTETPALHDFQNRYLKLGTVYPVVFGGVQRGTASVTKLEGADWEVQLNSDVPIQGLTMALVVGSPSLDGHGSSRRLPTASEENHIEQVAKKILTSKGVPSASLTRMRLDQVTATELNHAPKLVAAVEVERADKLGMEYSVFFVADPVSNENSVIWFQHSKGETDAEAVYLIDQLDVEKNGTDSMFVRRVFYENYRYEVYKNRNGRWVKEFTSEVFGCL